MGVHPTRCGEFESASSPEAHLSELLCLAKENRGKVVAIGECGLGRGRVDEQECIIVFIIIRVCVSNLFLLHVCVCVCVCVISW